MLFCVSLLSLLSRKTTSMTTQGTAGESIAYRVIIACILGPAVTIPLCAVRLYTKVRILRNTGYDDYAIAFATLLAIGFSITTGYQTTNGLGKHIWDVPAYKFQNLMKIGDIAGPIFYNLSTLFIKVSLCLFYLRFSFSRIFRATVYTVMVVSVIYSLLAAFGFAWVCQPIEKYWDFSITTGSCINLDAFFLSTACINAATDLALLVLPFFIVKDLRLPKRRKLGVALMLMTGSFVLVVSFIRVKAVVRGMGKVATDATWAMVTNFIWLLVEVWMGIICTCLPTLHTFVKRQCAARRARANAGSPGGEVPDHYWIGLNDTPGGKPPGTKRVSQIGVIESKGNDPDLVTYRTVVCWEDSLGSASLSDARSATSTAGKKSHDISAEAS